MTLNDVQNFAVDNDCLFTWDPVTDATGYELRIGSTWENSAPLVNVTISGTSYQYTQVLDADTVLIKATAQGFEDSLNASTVTTPAAPIIADVQNLAIVADELNFDAVTDATGYEVRFAKGFQSDAVDSLILATPSNNDPLSVPNSAGFRFFVRALGPCNTKSSVYSELWQPFDTSGDCSPADSSTDYGFLFDIDNVGTGLQLYKGKNAQLIGQLLTLIAGTNITLDETPTGIVINSTGGGGALNLNDLTDVQLQNLLAGQILQYDDVTGKFLNVDPTPASAPTWTPSVASVALKVDTVLNNAQLLDVSDGVEISPADDNQSDFSAYISSAIDFSTGDKKGFYFSVESLPANAVAGDIILVLAYDDPNAVTVGVPLISLSKVISGDWELDDPNGGPALGTFTDAELLAANICCVAYSLDSGVNFTFDFYVRSVVGTSPTGSVVIAPGITVPPLFIIVQPSFSSDTVGALFKQYTSPPFEYSGVDIISGVAAVDPASYPTPRADTSFIITGLSTYPATVTSDLGEVYDGVTFTFDSNGEPSARTVREPSAGASSLNSLTDVELSSLNGGQLLQYNTTAGKFVNVDGDLNSLTDVELSSLSDGQLLQYDATEGKFLNVDGAAVDLSNLPVLAESFLTAKSYDETGKGEQLYVTSEKYINWQTATTTGVITGVSTGTKQLVGLSESRFLIVSSTISLYEKIGGVWGEVLPALTGIFTHACKVSDNEFYTYDDGSDILQRWRYSDQGFEQVGNDGTFTTGGISSGLLALSDSKLILGSRVSNTLYGLNFDGQDFTQVSTLGLTQNASFTGTAVSTNEALIQNAPGGFVSDLVSVRMLSDNQLSLLKTQQLPAPLNSGINLFQLNSFTFGLINVIDDEVWLLKADDNGDLQEIPGTRTALQEQFNAQNTVNLLGDNTIAITGNFNSVIEIVKFARG